MAVKFTKGASLTPFKIGRTVALSACLVSALAVVACGGGGGGGGTPAPGPGGQVAPPPVNFSIPATMTSSVREGSASQGVTFPQFTINAPSNEAPANIVFEGADARFFDVTIQVSDPPNAAGDRLVKVEAITKQELDFETPADENRDNIYTFTLRGTYRGTAFSSVFTIKVDDVTELTIIRSRIIQGEFPQQGFASVMEMVPDVTGDLVPDLATSIQTGLGGASGYVLRSQSLFEATKGLYSLVALTGATILQNYGLRLNSLAGATKDQPNFVSAVASGGGTDLSVSEVSRDRIVVSQIRTQAHKDALTGAVDAAALPNRTIYNFPAKSGWLGRILGDVNADGVSDIFIRKFTPLAPQNEFAIVYGRPNSAGTSVAIAQGDIRFTYRGDRDGRTPMSFQTRLLPDLDRDGQRELLIFFETHQYSGVPGATAWIIRGSALRAALATPITLETMPKSVGTRITINGLTSIDLLPDYDNDGIPTLLFCSKFISQAVDGDNILDFAWENSDNNGPFPGQSVPEYVLGARVIGDLTGDGVPEILGQVGPFGDFNILSGVLLRDLIVSGKPSISPNLVRVSLNGVRDGKANLSQATAFHYVSETRQIVIGIGNDGPPTGPNPGRIIIISEADLKAAFSRPLFGIQVE